MDLAKDGPNWSNNKKYLSRTWCNKSVFIHSAVMADRIVYNVSPGFIAVRFTVVANLDYGTVSPM